MIEKIIPLLLATTGQVADIVTTWIILGMGGIEKNPLLGPDPNLFFVLMVKLAILALAFYLLKGVVRTRVLALAATIGFAAAGWNLYVLQAATGLAANSISS